MENPTLRMEPGIPSQHPPGLQVGETVHNQLTWLQNRRLIRTTFPTLTTQHIPHIRQHLEVVPPTMTRHSNSMDLVDPGQALIALVLTRLTTTSTLVIITRHEHRAATTQSHPTHPTRHTATIPRDTIRTIPIIPLVVDTIHHQTIMARITVMALRTRTKMMSVEC